MRSFGRAAVRAIALERAWERPRGPMPEGVEWCVVLLAAIAAAGLGDGLLMLAQRAFM
jgi:hypothetical protein